MDNINYKFGERIKVKVKENSKWYFRVFIAYDEQYHRVLTLDPKYIEGFKNGLGFNVEPWGHHEPITEDDYEITVTVKTTSHCENDNEITQQRIKKDVYDKVLGIIKSNR